MKKSRKEKIKISAAKIQTVLQNICTLHLIIHDKEEERKKKEGKKILLKTQTSLRKAHIMIMP